MKSKVTIAVFIFTLLGGYLVKAAIVQLPDNEAALVNSTVTFKCTAHAAAPNSRIMWFEFVSHPEGAIISDGRHVLSHPNRARYQLTGEDNEFNLQISDVTLKDAGRYICQDTLAAPPATFRAEATLGVLKDDPTCATTIPFNGALLEGSNYSSECSVEFGNGIAPRMLWSGPGPFVVQYFENSTSVRSTINFTAHRGMETLQFISSTRFMFLDDPPPYHANNTPAYRHTYKSPAMVVYRAPTNVSITPVKSSYMVGDRLSCSSDSRPIANYMWTNMRTLQSLPGSTFIITSDLGGLSQMMQCRASTVIEGFLYSADTSLLVSVVAETTTTRATTTTTTTTPTTTATPTTTTPTTTTSLDTACGDLTGRWGTEDGDFVLHLDVDNAGNVWSLFRNVTDLFFLAGNGNTDAVTFRHVGFTGVYPANYAGVVGFTGECHRCNNKEVILLSGVSRDKAKSPGCGQSAGTHQINYELVRTGPGRNIGDAAVYRPSEQHIRRFGIRPKNIIV